MDASFLFEEKKEVVEIKKPTWPDIYYAETEPEKRLEMLETVLNSEYATNDDKIRKQLFDLRYKPNGKGGKFAYIDNFLRVLLDCIYFGAKKSGINSPKIIKKNVEKDLKSINYYEVLEMDDDYKNLYSRELQAMAFFYIDICEKDKQYNSFLLGFGKISGDRRKMKVASDFYAAIYGVSKKNDMFEQLYLWNKSLLTAFKAKYDDWEKLMTILDEQNKNK